MSIPMKRKDRPDLRPMRTKTLEELEGVFAGAPPFDSYLVRTIYALRRKPIGEFTTEDLRITIGQSRGLPYLLPIALERLESDPLAEGHHYRGDLLLRLLEAEPYWGAQAEVQGRVRRIVEQALARLTEVQPVNWEAGELPNPDEPDYLDREHLEPRLREALGKLS